MQKEATLTMDFAYQTPDTATDEVVSTEATSRAEIDKALVVKIQAGETENFVLLYDAYLDKIYRFLYFRTSHQETAEDLASQAFLKAFDKIQSFDASKGTFQSWLYRIAHNLLIDHYRVPKRDVDISAAENIASNSSPEQDTERELTIAQIQKLLTTLPEASQELIVLRIWEELPYSEIAKIMDKSEASLKMQFSRIIAGLRNHPMLMLSIIIVATWGTNL